MESSDVNKNNQKFTRGKEELCKDRAERRESYLLYDIEKQEGDVSIKTNQRLFAEDIVANLDLEKLNRRDGNSRES